MTAIETPETPDLSRSTSELASRLAADLAGAVLLPTMPGYDDEVASFNAGLTHRPDVVVAAATAEDVRAAVAAASELGVTIGVQATGHGALEPLTGGLLISTRRLDLVEVDPAARTARVGAGVTWRQVIDAAGRHGLAPLNGSASNVGVVGYLLGGGLPVMGRRFGFAADHVRALEVVTPDAVRRTVDAVNEPDLFWGLRGGAGNLAVVTEVTIDLFPVSTVYGGGIYYAEESIPTVLHGYREWSATLPDACCTSVAVVRLPPLPDVPEPLRGKTVAHLRVCHIGDAAEGERLLAPMRQVATPMIDMVGPMPYGAVDQIHQDPDHPVPFTEAGVLLRELTADTVDAILAHVGPGVPSPVLMCELRQLGGAFARQPEHPNAVGGRDAGYSLFCLAILAPPIADIAPAAVAAVVEAAEPWTTGQTALNLHGHRGDEADRARAWTPQDYRRLGALRGQVDPRGLLVSGHVIAPRAPMQG